MKEQKQQSAIEIKVMESLKLDDDIAKLIFRTDYLFALQWFNLNHKGTYHSADYVINWVAQYLIEKCGYERMNGR